MESTLNNNIPERHFEMEVSEQHVFVEYQENMDTINLIYTHIPNRLIGTGAFRMLAESVISFAKSAKVKLIATDTLFKNYLPVHPDHSRLFKALTPGTIHP
ncbi:N-acetyltransferase [Mucilaginibacter sp. UR6-1]|uniref:N-acetyltransferase n=1 Tax=Mucilaginibacter sp. UR6-1 TaxID=1435643 RepID=UPI001E52E905|nr:N-acetyltransferase [Mucilaginibacter sp. UR6-1]MCC8407756.1 N-acetyltransferase [Mucilaginibacter sp. UR6-1]